MVFDVVEDGGDVVVETAFFAVGVCYLEEDRGLVGCVGWERVRVRVCSGCLRGWEGASSSYLFFNKWND